MKNLVNQIIEKYTTGEDFVLPRGYRKSISDFGQINCMYGKNQNQKGFINIILWDIIYTGKKENMKQYSPIIEVTLNNENDTQITSEFNSVLKVAKAEVKEI